jgi:hypothetical protein
MKQNIFVVGQFTLEMAVEKAREAKNRFQPKKTSLFSKP